VGQKKRKGKWKGGIKKRVIRRRMNVGSKRVKCAQNKRGAKRWGGGKLGWGEYAKLILKNDLKRAEARTKGRQGKGSYLFKRRGTSTYK